MKERFKNTVIKEIPLKHDVIVGTISAQIIKCILRYLLMAAYLYTCGKFGLYNYGFISKIIVALTSICLSRWIVREIGRIIYGNELDDPPFEEIGLIACIRSVIRMKKRL